MDCPASMDDLLSELLRAESTSPIEVQAGHTKPNLLEMVMADRLQARDTSFSAPRADSARQPAVIDRLNRGGLLQARYGDLARAGSLCRKAIQICLHECTTGKNRSWLQGVINPYTNLGRLASMRGECDLACRIYLEVFEMSIGKQNLTVDGTEIEAADFYAKRSSLQSGDVSTIKGNSLAVYLIETSRALLTVRRYADAKMFLAVKISELDNLRSEYPVIAKLEPWLYELSVRASTGCGAHQDALEIAESRLSSERTPLALAARLTYAETLASASDIEAAKHHWGEALDLLRTGQFQGRQFSHSEYYLTRLAIGRIVHTGASLSPEIEAFLENVLVNSDEVSNLKFAMLASHRNEHSSRQSEHLSLLRTNVNLTDYRLEKSFGYGYLFLNAMMKDPCQAASDLTATLKLISTYDGTAGRDLQNILEPWLNTTCKEWGSLDDEAEQIAGTNASPKEILDAHYAELIHL